jgi:hypothetical protein
MHNPLSIGAVGAIVVAGILGIPRIAGAACTVSNSAIRDKWLAMGGASASSPMGPCVGDAIPDGLGGSIQQFQGGCIVFNPDLNFNEVKVQAHSVWGAIGSAWTSRYGGTWIGEPINDPVPMTGPGGSAVAWYSVFVKNGAVTFLVWSPGGGPSHEEPCWNSDNVCEVFGTIGGVWIDMVNSGAARFESPVWGMPTTDVYQDGNGHGVQDFQHATVTWNNSTGLLCTWNPFNPDGPSLVLPPHASPSGC